MLGKPLLGIKDHYSNALFIHLSGTKIYKVKIKQQDLTLLKSNRADYEVDLEDDVDSEADGKHNTVINTHMATQ